MKKIFLSTIAWALLALPLFVKAADSTCPQGEVCVEDPLAIGKGGAFELYGRLIGGFTAIIGAVALLFFVFGGFMMLTSAGNEEKIKKGKETLMWAAIGMTVILGSYFILSYIISVLTEQTGYVPPNP